MKPVLPKSDRPVQATPEEILRRLTAQIRGQFCGDISDAEWFKSHHQFIRVKVILWPARFMVGKGFTLPADRYEAIMLDILGEIKRHGQTGAVRYWPGYLMKCVQDHWRHHWEEYYEEAKSVRNVVTAALLAGKVSPEDRTVDTLAAAHRVLTAKKVTKKVVAPRQQLSLFGT